MANKKHLIAHVAADQSVTPAQASASIDAVLNAISHLSFQEGSLTLRGFGKFSARLRARKVITTRISPGTEPVVSPSRLALCFSAGLNQKIELTR
jgi:nucleoid DNA-binding protein